MSVDISFSIGEHIEGRDSNPRGREREVREFSELSNSERSEAERSKARKKPAEAGGRSLMAHHRERDVS